MALVRLFGEEIAIACSAEEGRRLEDLALAVEARADWFANAPPEQRLALAALSLMDETQTAGAALARARAEIERLSELMADAGLVVAPASLGEQRGRIAALKPPQR